MRKVSTSKYSFTYKDIFRWFGIITLHFIAYYTIVMTCLGIHWTLYKIVFFPTIDETNWVIIYGLSIGPIISSILHIVYSERGLPWLRGAMWIHAVGLTCIIPIIIF